MDSVPPDEQVFQNFVPEVLQLVDQLRSSSYDKAAMTQQVIVVTPFFTSLLIEGV